MTNTKKAFYLADSLFGFGLFAARAIGKGESIYLFTGHPISFELSISMGKGESYALQRGKKEYMLLDPPGKFINHSCDPNCGVKPDLVLIAIRDIMAGEQLFFDYSTTMLERHWVMACKCGSYRCRGIIRDFDLIPAETQAAYISQDIVQPFIVDQLELDKLVRRAGSKTLPSIDRDNKRKAI